MRFKKLLVGIWIVLFRTLEWPARYALQERARALTCPPVTLIMYSQIDKMSIDSLAILQKST